MNLETERLILREWTEDDAINLYRFAKDPKVGPIAGWPVHTDVENSREIIKNVLAVDENYAIILKDEDLVVGCAGLMVGDVSNLDISPDEAEIGYWIGVPYWGKGLIPEATRELMRHGFKDLGLKKIWCGHFDGNQNSWRVQEKCGFKFHHTEKDVPWPLLDTIITQHISCITKEEWLENQENK